MRLVSLNQRGFTLIELLIVITIIGLLASVILVGLQGFREAGRDVRRIADLRYMQVGLELYFKKCSFYPGGNNCANNASVDATDSIANPNPGRSWAQVTQALKTSGLHIPNVPNDPLTPERTYFYASDRTPGQESLHYVMKAILEDVNNQALRDSLRDADITGISIHCGRPGDVFYCLGL